MTSNEEIEDIPDSIYEGIGRIVTQWAIVEQLVGQFLAYLVSGDVVLMFTVTQNVSSSTVSEWVNTLLPVRIKEQTALEQIQDLMRRVDDLRRERNLVVHGLWKPAHEDGTALVQTMRWNRVEIMKTELVTTADMGHLVTRVEEAVHELLGLGKELGFHPPPAPATTQS